MNVPENKPEAKESDFYVGYPPDAGNWKGEAFLGCFGFFIVLIVLIAVVHDYTQPRTVAPCDRPKSIACLDQRVQECMTLDKYSKDQCVILVGGNK